MTKISNDTAYIQDIEISDLDYIIGTDGNTIQKRTKNFFLGALRNYFLAGATPEFGGTLRITEISYTGNTYATVEDVVNNLDPIFAILQYHIVIVSLNGAKSILKLQNRNVGIDELPVVSTDFINFPVSVGPTGPQGATGSTGAQGNIGNTGSTGNGVASVTKTGTVGLIDTYTITFTSGATTTFTVANGANGAAGIDASSNLQRVVNASFTLSNSDNNYTIFIDNGINPVTITIPSGLSANLNVTFLQEGTADVNFLASGTTFNSPSGMLKIKGQNHWAHLEKKLAVENYKILGSLKV